MAGKSYFIEIFCLVIFIQASIGKEEAILGEFPWTVSLRLSGFLGHDCGAAILNSVRNRFQRSTHPNFNVKT